MSIILIDETNFDLYKQNILDCLYHRNTYLLDEADIDYIPNTFKELSLYLNTTAVFLVHLNNRVAGLLTFKILNLYVDYRFYKHQHVCNMSFINLSVISTYMALYIAKAKNCISLATKVNSNILYTTIAMFLKDYVQPTQLVKHRLGYEEHNILFLEIRDVASIDTNTINHDRLQEKEQYINEINKWLDL